MSEQITSISFSKYDINDNDMVDIEIENDIQTETEKFKKRFSSSSYSLSEVTMAFEHASSADETFLSNPSELQKEIIRLKMEMAQLQSSLDTQESLAIKLSEENHKIKHELTQTQAQRDHYKEKYDSVLLENMKLRCDSITLKQETINLKRERDELIVESEWIIKRANELEATNEEYERILTQVIEHVDIHMSLQKKEESEECENLALNESFIIEKDPLTGKSITLPPNNFHADDTVSELTKEIEDLREYFVRTISYKSKKQDESPSNTLHEEFTHNEERSTIKQNTGFLNRLGVLRRSFNST